MPLGAELQHIHIFHYCGNMHLNDIHTKYLTEKPIPCTDILHECRCFVTVLSRTLTPASFGTDSWKDEWPSRPTLSWPKQATNRYVNRINAKEAHQKLHWPSCLQTNQFSTLKLIFLKGYVTAWAWRKTETVKRVRHKNRYLQLHQLGI
jgi:hypothetical protein